MCRATGSGTCSGQLLALLAVLCGCAWRGVGAATSCVINATAADWPYVPPPAPAVRNPLFAPFANWSIWNLPIGADAVYVPARLNFTYAKTSFYPDYDIILFDTSQPVTPLYKSNAGWSGAKRCLPDPPLTVLQRVPLNVSFVALGTADNYATAALLPDNRTIAQSQPFSNCGGFQYNATDGSVIYNVTIQSTWPSSDLYTDGLRGAHGGSYMSSVGGTLRIGELMPDPVTGQVVAPRHALKANVFGFMNLYRNGSQVSSCYRWPAATCDSSFATGNKYPYGGNNTALRMGSLLALPPTTNLTALGLSTRPGLALAWTLQHYGMYVVDDTLADAFCLEAEMSYAGQFGVVFKRVWGNSFQALRDSKNNDVNPWTLDLKRLFSALHVVDSWNASVYARVQKSDGAMGAGGGAPLQPWAPPISPPLRVDTWYTPYPLDVTCPGASSASSSSSTGAAVASSSADSGSSSAPASSTGATTSSTTVSSTGGPSSAAGSSTAPMSSTAASTAASTASSGGGPPSSTGRSSTAVASSSGHGGASADGSSSGAGASTAAAAATAHSSTGAVGSTAAAPPSSTGAARNASSPSSSTAAAADDAEAGAAASTVAFGLSTPAFAGAAAGVGAVVIAAVALLVAAVKCGWCCGGSRSKAPAATNASASAAVGGAPVELVTTA